MTATDVRHSAAVVRMCLTEAGYPDTEVEVTAADGMVVESCGDCDCPNGGRDDNCGPPAEVVHRAFALAALGVELGRTGYRTA